MPTASVPVTSTAAASSSSEPLEHPLDIGDRAGCVRGNGDSLPIEVIDRRQDGDGGWSYYVHFEGTDRRLDDWVNASKLESLALPPPPPSVGRGRGAGGVRGSPAAPGSQRRATRAEKRKIDVSNNVQSVADEELEKEHEESTKVKNVKVIEIGTFEVDAWYFSPYPEAFGEQERLFICPFSLKYFKNRSAYLNHLAGVHRRGPPGLRIYRAPAPPLSTAVKNLGLPQPHKLTFYEVDGSTAKVYCQCLCLLAKLFLDHKTLYYDVDPFLFYVLCEENEHGDETLAGYFSKEKMSGEGNNIACILVLPPHQRKGYGKLLIDLAYNITIREGKLGSPEKPLSDLGQLSFRSYWTEVLLEEMRSSKGNNTSIKDIAQRTGIKTDDIIATLQSLNLIKFWKGQHVIAVSPKIVDEHLNKNARKSLRCDPACLTWQPPLVSADGS